MFGAGGSAACVTKDSDVDVMHFAITPSLPPCCKRNSKGSNALCQLSTGCRSLCCWSKGMAATWMAPVFTVLVAHVPECSTFAPNILTRGIIYTGMILVSWVDWLRSLIDQWSVIYSLRDEPGHDELSEQMHCILCLLAEVGAYWPAHREATCGSVRHVSSV